MEYGPVVGAYRCKYESANNDSQGQHCTSTHLLVCLNTGQDVHKCMTSGLSKVGQYM